MIVRFAKGLLILVSTLWMLGSGWTLFSQPANPDAEAYRQQMFEQKMKDCRGQFSQRYDCMSTLLRQQSSALAGSWAGRLLLIFGPPLVASVAYVLFRSRGESRREKMRNMARLERREREAREALEREKGPRARVVTEDEPLREIDEIRRRAAERRRAAREKRGDADDDAERPLSDDRAEWREPPSE